MSRGDSGVGAKSRLPWQTSHRNAAARPPVETLHRRKMMSDSAMQGLRSGLMGAQYIKNTGMADAYRLDGIDQTEAGHRERRSGKHSTLVYADWCGCHQADEVFFANKAS